MSDLGSDADQPPDTPEAAVFDATVTDGVCRLGRATTRFLSTGFDGGETVADAAYNVTVPDGWPEQPLRPYVDERLADAGFDVGSGTESPPVLLTGVAQQHAHRARCGSVEAVATVGLSNPAGLPVDGVDDVAAAVDPGVDDVAVAEDLGVDDADPVGTVNLFVGTTRSLAPGVLPNLVAVAAAAKATTLLATTGFPGTTSDAVVVGCDPNGERAAFSGAATPVGAATRACVRDAVVAAVESRYGDETDASLPESVAAADHGVVTDERATVVQRVAGDDEV